LIVIAIIGVLASLIAAAAVRAWNNARRARIVLEINGVSQALETFRNDFNAYPPNAMYVPGDNAATGTFTVASADMVRMVSQAFPRIDPREREVFLALAGTVGPQQVVNQPLEGGMTAAEALFFWLGGFSSDPQFPLSGPGGPAFLVNGNGEVLEDRQPRYDFNLGQLGPQSDDGKLDVNSVRYIEYALPLSGETSAQDRRINLWHYRPNGSEQPLVYFDASRHKPGQYDMYAVDPSLGPAIYAFKQLRATASAANNISDLVFVNQDKFQVLHCGIDDAWGEDLQYVGSPTGKVNNVADVKLLYPTGPFMGDVADNLSNFYTGDLEDEQPE
jgi:hypothetical protein